jgi:hypothetical protein
LFEQCQTPLGPSLMKKRHLEAAGYIVGHINHWEYTLSATHEEKCHILRRVLDSLVENT